MEPKEKEKENDVQKLQNKIVELEKLVQNLNCVVNSKDQNKEIHRICEENAILTSKLNYYRQKDHKQSHMMFALSHQHRSKLSTHHQISHQQYLLNREYNILQNEVTKWVNTIVGSNLQTNEFLLDISNGIILCQLVNHINPKLSPLKYHARASSQTMFAHENVQMFLSRCAELGVPSISLFDSSSLVNHQNIKQKEIINCCLHLARVAIKYGITPPTLIQYEMEIEEKEKKNLVSDTTNVTSDTDKPTKLKVDLDNLTTICQSYQFPSPQLLPSGKYLLHNDIPPCYIIQLNEDFLVQDPSHKYEWIEIRHYFHNLLSSKKYPSKDKTKENENTTKDNIIESKDQKLEDITTNPTTSPDSSVPLPPAETENKIEVTDTETKTETHTETVEDKEMKKEEKIDKMDTTLYSAHQEFFYLTACAVRMTHELPDDEIVINNEELFQRCMKANVEFYDYHEWITHELTKIYLEQLHQSRLNRPTDLRGHRMQAMQSLHNREARRQSRV